MTYKELKEYTKDLKLLYVEDDVAMQKTSSELFKNFFGSIEIANDGLEGLNMYRANKYDLIITDIAMPKMDGIELIKNIRLDDPLIPIIAYSAWNDPSLMTACISLNIDAYLIKPLHSKNFVEAVQKIVFKIQSIKPHANDYSMIDLHKQELRKKYEYDKLTGLRSHIALLEKIENLKNFEIPVIILINIDEFHIYNEIYGLTIGDEILKKFVVLLQNFIKETNFEIYRMGGDEFILFEVSTMIDPDEYVQKIEALIHYIEINPIVIPVIKEAILLSITVGISFDKENSYGKADMAVQEARKQGRQYLGYNSEADRREALQKNLYWREEINKALEEKRVHAFYQPIVNKNQEIIKYEALIRLKQYDVDGSIKLIAPHMFLDFSKISRQYIGLTTVMIQEAFHTMIEKNLHISINLTFHDIENREINRLLRENIHRHHLATKTNFDISSQVIFELLEHPKRDYDLFVDFINEYKRLGVLITIDNFGLGFSDMSKIVSLAPHYVKLDSSLIKNIDSDKHAYSLVKAIVKFTQELGIKTIAEHVSSREIYETVKELGIDEFQGYYFGEPSEEIMLKLQ
ncbi:EAL domain-containing protein [Sulfurimonas sp. NWX79]|uniref:EAL domain-containing response regulator n=1 Tax=Sulfurimonas sp. NWX79 TaxID=2925412 RepID=UPI003204A20E